MNIRICYVYPANCGEHFTELAIRFVESYYQNPPNAVHDSIIVLNGTRLNSEIVCLFSPLQNVTFLERSNDGYDIGAYQEAAEKFPSDMMVFFGASTYLKSPGWLTRMGQAFMRHGPTLYGVMGHRGNLACGVHPHIRTTGFWCPTDLMNRYPHRITRPEQRYGFEHGANCFANWVKAQGLKIWVVAANGSTYPEPEWDNVPNGFHKGTQDNLMCGDRLTAPPFHPCM